MRTQTVMILFGVAAATVACVMFGGAALALAGLCAAIFKHHFLTATPMVLGGLVIALAPPSGIYWGWRKLHDIIVNNGSRYK